MEIIKYGICIDNQDPYGAGRIRVIMDRELINYFNTTQNVNKVINKLDSNNNYIPWEFSTQSNGRDPYVYDALLPKHLNIVPKIGEGVKIVYNKPHDYGEYIAPQISDYKHINFDNYENGRSFSNKAKFHPIKNNLRKNGYFPDPIDIALIGRKNSDIVLPENEVLIRAGHQNQNNETKNNNHAILQISGFEKDKRVSEKLIRVDKTPIKLIQNVIELTMDNDLKGSLKIYDTSNLLNTNNYRPKEKYNFQNLNIVINFESKSENELIKFIQNILYYFDNNKSYCNFTNDTKNNVTYNAINNRINTTGVIQDHDFIDLGLYAFRFNPNQDFSKYSYLTKNFENELRPQHKKPTTNVVSEKRKITESLSGQDSAIILGANKTFLLSWEEEKKLYNFVGKYGISQEDIYLKLLKKTEPLVRGNQLIELLKRILRILETHGHSQGGAYTINNDAKNEINRIKEILNAVVDENLNGGTKLLNYKIRIS